MERDILGGRIRELEQRIEMLEQLPERLDAVEVRLGTVEVRLGNLSSQVVQLREEMRGEFSAVRGEMRSGLSALREEMQAGDAALRTEMHALHDEWIRVVEGLNAETNRQIAETRRHMLVLHEEVIDRLKRLDDGWRERE